MSNAVQPVGSSKKDAPMDPWVRRQTYQTGGSAVERDAAPESVRQAAPGLVG